MYECLYVYMHVFEYMWTSFSLCMHQCKRMCVCVCKFMYGCRYARVDMWLQASCWKKVWGNPFVCVQLDLIKWKAPSIIPSRHIASPQQCIALYQLSTRVSVCVCKRECVGVLLPVGRGCEWCCAYLSQQPIVSKMMKELEAFIIVNKQITRGNIVCVWWFSWSWPCLFHPILDFILRWPT